MLLTMTHSKEYTVYDDPGHTNIWIAIYNWNKTLLIILLHSLLNEIKPEPIKLFYIHSY